ncbi:MAG: DUF4440 domain-containing protein [Acidobacteria bacterium]|nr:DUF4440 domain-containing protein [Acidobacteriota bacterium]
MTPTELIQDLFAAFGRGDIPYILDRLTPDCRWIAPGNGIPNAGVYSGPEGASEFFRRLAASENITRFEPREFFAKGDSVVALGYEACTTSSGKAVDTEWAMLFRVRDGKVSMFQSYYDTSAYMLAHQ